MSKPKAVLSIAFVVLSLTSVAACGGKSSTASVCSKLQSDSNSEPQLGNFTEANASQAASEIKDFASKVKSDTSNASNSSLASAGSKFATDLDTLSGEIPTIASNPSSAETLLNSVEADGNAIQGFCPNLH